MLMTQWISKSWGMEIVNNKDYLSRVNIETETVLIISKSKYFTHIKKTRALHSAAVSNC